MDLAEKTPQKLLNDLATAMKDTSGCSQMTRLCAAWEKVACTKLRRKAVLSLPTGTVLKTMRRMELTLPNRKEELPWFIGEVPDSVESRKLLWKQIQVLNVQGFDCFVYPPGAYPMKDAEIAHFLLCFSELA